jgi:cytochrome c556
VSKKFCFSLVILTALSTALPTIAFGASADERAQAAVDTRQGLLKVVVSYFGPIVGMARKQIPFDAALVEKNAAKIAQLAPMIPDVFRMDTRAYDLETEALDNIWDNTDDFADKAATVAERAAALSAAAADGEAAAMKAFGAVGAACKGCHDEYRVQQ